MRVRLPDGREINVQTNDPQEAAAAGRRIIATEQAAKGIAQGHSNPGLESLANGFTFGLTRQAGAVGNAAGQGINNLIDRVQGKTPDVGVGDAYNGYLQAASDAARDFQSKHPVASTGLGVLGGLAAPGATQIGKFVTEGVGSGLAAARGVVPSMVRGALAGTGIGATSSAANAEPGQQLQQAAQGAKLGAALGTAAPVVEAGVRAAAPAVGKVAQFVARTTGNKGDPLRVAAQKLAQALDAEGLAPADARTAMNQWLQQGNDAPAIIDLAKRGGPVQRLVRGAAAEGSGAGQAAQYADQVAGNIQDRTQALAQNLTPGDLQTAAQARDAADVARSAQAKVDYAQPTQQRIPITPELAAGVADAPGKAAINKALEGAISQQDYGQAADLQKLLALHVDDIPGMSPDAMQRIRAQYLTKSGDISAGAADRVRQALNETAENRYSALGDKNRAVGAGLFSRAGQVDSTLDAVPGMDTARSNFAENSRAMQATDTGGAILNAPPPVYAADMAQADSLPAVANAQTGAREAITNAIGNPTAGSTGALNRLTTSNNVGQNLAATFGQDATDAFRGGVGNEISRLRNARFIDPSTGSQTAGRLADTGLVDAIPDHIPTTAHGVVGKLVAGAVRKLNAGNALSDGEKAALVGMSTGDTSGLLQHLEDIAAGKAQPPTGLAALPGAISANAVPALSYRPDAQ